MSDAELADYYNRTHDLSEFEGGESVPVTWKLRPDGRHSTFAVRFTGAELDAVTQAARMTGVTVDEFIRSSALSDAEHTLYQR